MPGPRSYPNLSDCSEMNYQLNRKIRLKSWFRQKRGRIITVQECNATMLTSSNTGWFKKMNFVNGKKQHLQRKSTFIIEKLYKQLL
jgi:hypothetical protein